MNSLPPWNKFNDISEGLWPYFWSKWLSRDVHLLLSCMKSPKEICALIRTVAQNISILQEGLPLPALHRQIPYIIQSQISTYRDMINTWRIVEEFKHQIGTFTDEQIRQCIADTELIGRDENGRVDPHRLYHMSIRSLLFDELKKREAQI